MADNRNFAALDWLVREIGETLKEARQALEAYVENPKDAVRIRFCLTHIHQVHGSLKMVEFFGAAMLAEEMERLTQAMIEERVANEGEAQEVLMRAILQFPVYLEQVKTTRKDNPLVVLPLLNDLRAVRGESLLTDTKLFVPNLAPAKKVSGARSAATQDNAQFQAMALKLRQMYQYAAAGYIRAVDGDENLKYLQKVFGRLHKLTQGTARNALWDICLALAEALELDALEISVAVKNLLRQLDKEIKILAVHGTKALNSYTNDELIKNLLYYVARAGKHVHDFPPNSHLKRVCDSYRLDEALIEGNESEDTDSSIMSAPDPEAIRSVVEAIKTELNSVKNALDVCLSGGDMQVAVEEALPVVKRIADTMAVLGLGDIRKQVLEQGAALEMMAKSSSPVSHDHLMAIASKVLETEDALDILAEQQSASPNYTIPATDADITLTRAKESVLRESRNGLEHAKDAIVEYIASQWDRTHLQNVPATLREIRGGLDIMPLPRAAKILGACARYIDEQLLTQQVTPQWTSLDTLADAITSVEYYLERLSGGSDKDENDLLLTVAEESVATLGYSVAAAPRIDLDVEDIDSLYRKHTGDIQITTPSEKSSKDKDQPIVTTHLETEPHQDDSVPVEIEPAHLSTDIAHLHADLIDETSPSASANTEELDAAADTVFETPEHELPEALVSPETYLVEITPDDADLPEDTQVSFVEPVDDHTFIPAAEAVVVAAPPSIDLGEHENLQPVKTSVVLDEDDDDYIDDEIVGIFVEEASEVLNTIAEYFPRWMTDFNDAEALTEFRRAFHTLKGSGRMVGANDIGELSWSIENMLNRIIDQSIEPAAPHVLIIQKVRNILPSMIDAFSVRQPNPIPETSEHYRVLAHALSKGELPEELLSESAAAQTHQALAPEEFTGDIATEQDEAVSDALHAVDAMAGDQALEVPAATTTNHSEADVEPITATNPPSVDDESTDDSDAQLWDIFGAEALTHLEVVQEFIARMEAEAPCYETPSDEMQRALHTLKGSAHMAEITPIAELAAPLEKFVKELRSYHVVINDDILQLLRDGVSYTQAGLTQIENNEAVDIPRLHQFVARVQELRDIHIAPLAHQQETEGKTARTLDPELLAIFMAEEMNLLLDADKIIEQWKADPAELSLLQPVSEELRNLIRGAQHAYLPPMIALGEQLEHLYREIIGARLACSNALCMDLNTAHSALLDMVDAVAAGQNLSPAPAPVVESINTWLQEALNYTIDLGDSANDSAEPPSVPDEAELLEPTDDAVAEIETPVTATSLSEAPDSDAIESHDLDDEDSSLDLTGIVIDVEADEIAEPLATDELNEFIPSPIDLGDEIILGIEGKDSDDDALALDLIPTLSSVAILDSNAASAQADTGTSEPLALAEEIELSFESVDFEAINYDALTDEQLADEELTDETLLDDGLEDDIHQDVELIDEHLLDGELIDVEFSHDELIDLEPFQAVPAADSLIGEISSRDTVIDVDFLREEKAHKPIIPEMLTHEDLARVDLGDTEIEISDDVVDIINVHADEVIHLDDHDLGEAIDALAEAEPLTVLPATDTTDEAVFEVDAQQAVTMDEADQAEMRSFASIVTLVDDGSEPDIMVDSLVIAATPREHTEPHAAANEPRTPEDSAYLDTPTESESSFAAPSPAPTPRTAVSTAKDDDVEPEIVEIFIEEALELLEDMERALHEWQDDWANKNAPEELKRCLHTFKGGARLCGLTNLGDLSHEYETLLIDMDRETQLDQPFFKQLNTYQDQLHAGVGEARTKLESGGFDKPVAVAPTIDTEPTSSPQASAQSAPKPTLVIDNSHLPATSGGTKPNVLTFAPKPKAVTAPLPVIPGSEFGGLRQGNNSQVQHLATRRAGPQEVIKVSAELLEELVNLAGETSISRGRMEQQVTDLSGAIDEMDSTIHRLQEQLRRLDIETEAQVLFRQEKMAQHEDFDPLEMDRYSHLQQLSRSLIESASDLMDLKRTLSDKTRDTETLLLQQSRINTDLQEGLMRSRMVPFSRLVPRLRRIVRQAATELGKEVDFQLDNVEGELDRTVLERMVAPLEHMLRNAVDHGIESPEERTAINKPAMGRIALSLSREGGDVMLRLADDGRGINLQKVREKAIERGLMAADAPLSDQDLMQFILHAGFSTADKITQISGRGVGMDVVHSEIKQLGGAMFIDSRWGEGTEFTIRLPFTVSVNRALMVQIGEDLYAIPLNTIEGIVRVSPFELEHYYQAPNARFDYAGDNYLVRYLGSMLESGVSPKLDGQALPLPVILVRSTENTVALQVDRLLGSREIVVKTLGAQFSAVRGVSGATVTGDGSVVVILDLHALIREQLALGLSNTQLLEPAKSAEPVIVEEEVVEKLVMVVDDSVTVRKVTGRFLEREGFRVIAAKDGVEALQILQDTIPDLMLLDIEMPRMDGFEVAKNIRTSSRLRELPIIMITSRTGQKHRDRAFELGVNKYMGKPYQEDMLLANIQELLK